MAAAAGAGNAPGAVDNFRLVDTGGRSWELYRSRDCRAVVVGAVAQGEPGAAAASRPVIEALQGLMGSAGTQDLCVFALDCLPPTSGALVGEPSKALPILADTAQDVTRDLGLVNVGDALIVQPGKEWTTVFRGALDTPGHAADFGAALKAVLGGQAPAPAAAAASGLALPLRAAKAYDFALDVAPILQAKCVACHAKGGVGPFALDSYTAARKWSRMMREVIRTAQMPPWHADPHFGALQGDRSLSVAQRETLLGWIAQGTPPAGDGSDPLAAAAKPVDTGWALGEPDAVVRLPEVQHLPKEGTIPYRYITVPTDLKDDHWLRGLEVRPTALAAVHHALIFIVYPKEYRHIQPQADGGLDGYFAAYLPGMELKPYPDEVGQFLPKGSTLIFQMHYNATGKEEADQTEIGFYFHKGTPAKALNIVAASETEFEIPAQAADQPVSASRSFPEAAEVWGLSPHMHYRGGRARFDLASPGTGRRTLLNVPFYQFDWQPLYIFETPIQVPAGSRIEVAGGFDNSKYNPKNPDPTKPVEFGEQSYEEMFIGYIALLEAATDDKYKAREVSAKDYVGLGQKLDGNNLAGTRWRFQDRQDSVELSLHAFGLASVGGFPSRWRYQDGTVIVTPAFDDPFPLSVVGDELLWTGNPLKRLE